jgi:hypothetical protein
VLWLIGIASVWLFVCLVAVSLCVMARRGDDALTAATAAVAPEVDAPFVLAFAEPEPVEAPRPPVRTPIH